MPQYLYLLYCTKKLQFTHLCHSISTCCIAPRNSNLHTYATVSLPIVLHQETPIYTPMPQYLYLLYCTKKLQFTHLCHSISTYCIAPRNSNLHTYATVSLPVVLHQETPIYTPMPQYLYKWKISVVSFHLEGDESNSHNP